MGGRELFIFGYKNFYRTGACSMKWTGLNELREKYLSFFESKGHLRLPSFSLVPKDDKSLLLINSGMAPMKNILQGKLRRRESA